MVNLSDCSPDYQHRWRSRQQFWSRVEDGAVAATAIASLIFLYAPQLSPQRKALDMVSYHQEFVDTTTSSVLVSNAQKWVGKDFNPGETAQCAYFVRAVLAESGLNVGVTDQPHDGYATSEGYANSFFGPDIGTLIYSADELKPGDLVAFSNTYGDWPQGTITHVGIYVGDSMMIDRPTASKPVQNRSISSFDFAVGVRLATPAKPQQPKPESISEDGKSLEAIAARLESEYGIPSDFTIAVGNHESGNGSAVIGVDNWFGVKASPNAIATSTHHTTEFYGGSEVGITDSFCADGCADSFARTVVNILKEQGKSPRGMSPDAIATSLDGRYASDPEWASKIKKHLRK